MSDHNDFQGSGQHERAILFSSRSSSQVILIDTHFPASDFVFPYGLDFRSVSQIAIHMSIPIRQDDSEIKKAFDDIEEIRRQFESIRRPSLEYESGVSPKKVVIPPGGESSDPSRATTGQNEIPLVQEDAPTPTISVSHHEHNLDPDAELAKLESEFGMVGRDYATEEITDWEFDALEQDLKLANRYTLVQENKDSAGFMPFE